MIIGLSLSLAAVLCYTMSTLFITLLRDRAGIVSTRYMLLIALAANIMLTVFTGGSLLPSAFSSVQLLYLAVSGILGLALGFILMIKAIILIGPRLVLLLITATSVFSFLFGWLFLGETESIKSLLFVALIIAGIIVVILNSSQKGMHRPGDAASEKRKLWAGIIYSLILALFQSCAMLLSKFVLQEGFSPFEVSSYRLLFASLGLALYVSFFGSRQAGFRKGFTPRERLLVILAAFAGPVSAVSLNFFSLSYISIGINSAMVQLSPVFMLLLSRMVFKEKIGPAAIGGTIIAVTGTVLLAVS